MPTTPAWPVMVVTTWPVRSVTRMPFWPLLPWLMKMWPWAASTAIW